MGSQNEQDERIEILRGLMERLSNPELTLAEAKDLRGRVTVLLERDNEPVGRHCTGSAPALVPYHEIGDGPLRSIWSPEPSMWAAG